jgi:hypothetical protein
VNELKTLKVRHKDGTIEGCSIEIAQAPNWKLIFSGAGLTNHQFSGDDLFDALISMRLTLEKIGVQTLCAGARRDVFPSGMSRDMSGGRKAYATRLGAPALRADLLDIFDYSDVDSVGSVEQQKMFHEKWIASLRK